MEDHLVVEEAYRLTITAEDGYCLVWLVTVDDGEVDHGAILGDSLGKETYSIPEATDEYWENRMTAYLASISDGVRHTSSGFIWETRTAAVKALKAIKMALKLGPNRPVPEWAQKALSEGWKPPKGWKP